MSATSNKSIESVLGNEIKTYMTNIEEISKVVNCAHKAKSSDNIYKTVASFENADIINSTEVPVGSEKTKMNKLLVAAISKLAPLVRDNLQLAGEAAKRWSEQVGDDNLQETLNAAVAKLRTPVKSQPIPSYSTLSEHQREAVQEVFQSVLKKQEPVSIDVITETIDRYNAGVDGTVLFNRLGMNIQHATSGAIVDYTIYESLLSDEVFAYLLSRWESYQNIINTIHAEPKITADTLSELLDGARFSDSNHVSAVIRKVTADLDIVKLMGEYEEQLKPSTDYVDLKPFIQNTDVIPTMSANMKSRLRGLGHVISSLSDVPFYEIQESESDIDSEDSYHAISVYFDIMQELTQNLTAYLYIAQTAIRNANIINDIVTVMNLVDNTLTDLFTKVHDVTVENGVVSQEGFKDILGKILGRPPKSKLDEREVVNEDLNAYNVVVNRANEHLELTDTLFRLKLREFNSLSEENITTFKDKHKKTISDLFSVNIASMDIHKLFNFMTNSILTAPINHGTVAPLTCNALNAKDGVSVAVKSFLNDPEDMIRLLNAPLVPSRYSFADSSIYLIKHFNKISSTANPVHDASHAKGIILPILTDFVSASGSYYSNQSDWLEVFDKAQLDATPAVLLKLDETVPRGDYVGYRLITPASQHKIHTTLAPNAKNKLTINGIKNNADMMKICKQQSTIRSLYISSSEFMGDKELGYLALNDMYDFTQGVMPDIVKSFTKNGDISKVEASQYTAVTSAIADDLRDAMADAKARDNLTQILYVLSTECTSTIKELYTSFNQVAEDFIAIAK